MDCSLIKQNNEVRQLQTAPLSSHVDPRHISSAHADKPCFQLTPMNDIISTQNRSLLPITKLEITLANMMKSLNESQNERDERVVKTPDVLLNFRFDPVFGNHLSASVRSFLTQKPSTNEIKMIDMLEKFPFENGRIFTRSATPVYRRIVLLAHNYNKFMSHIYAYSMYNGKSEEDLIVLQIFRTALKIMYLAEQSKRPKRDDEAAKLRKKRRDELFLKRSKHAESVGRATLEREYNRPHKRLYNITVNTKGEVVFLRASCREDKIPKFSPICKLPPKVEVVPKGCVSVPSGIKTNNTPQKSTMSAEVPEFIPRPIWPIVHKTIVPKQPSLSYTLLLQIFPNEDPETIKKVIAYHENKLVVPLGEGDRNIFSKAYQLALSYYTGSRDFIKKKMSESLSKSFFDVVKGAFAEWIGNSNLLERIFDLVVTTYCCYYAEGKLLRMFILLLYIKTIDPHVLTRVQSHISAIVNNCMKLARKSLDEDEAMENIGGFADPPDNLETLTSTAFAMRDTLFGFLGWPVNMIGRDNLNTLNSMNKLQRGALSARKIVEYLFDCVSWVADALYHSLTGDRLRVDVVQERYEKMERWVNTVNSLVISDIQQRIISGDVTMQTMDALFIEGNALYMEFFKDKVSTQLPFFTKALQTFQAAYETLKKFNVLKYGRIEPIVVTFIGPWGQGKTTLIDALGVDVCQSLNLPKYTAAHKYIWQPTEFHDGYNSQPFIVFEDFNKSIDPQRVAQEESEFMTLTTQDLAFINKANLSGKENCIPNSPFVFVTSNMQGYGGNTQMKDPSALVSRFGLILEVTLEKGPYIDEHGVKHPALDTDVSTSRVRCLDVDTERYSFRVAVADYNLESNSGGKKSKKAHTIGFRSTKRKMKYPDLVNYLVEKYKKRFSDQETTLGKLIKSGKEGHARRCRLKEEEAVPDLYRKVDFSTHVATPSLPERYEEIISIIKDVEAPSLHTVSVYYAALETHYQDLIPIWTDNYTPKSSQDLSTSLMVYMAKTFMPTKYFLSAREKIRTSLAITIATFLKDKGLVNPDNSELIPTISEILDNNTLQPKSSLFTLTCVRDFHLSRQFNMDYQSFRDWVANRYSKEKIIGYTFLVGIGLALGTFGVRKFILSNIVPKGGPKEYDRNARLLKHKKPDGKPPAKPTEILALTGSANALSNFAAHKLSKNHFILSYTDRIGFQHRMKCFFINGLHFTTTAHQFVAMRDAAKVYFGSTEIKQSWITARRFSNKDLVIAKFSVESKLQPRKNILSWFYDKEDFPFGAKESYWINYENGVPIACKVPVVLDHSDVRYKSLDVVYTNDVHYRIDYPAAAGDCGTYLFVEIDNVWKIIGILVAGSSTQTYFTSVNETMLSKLENDFPFDVESKSAGYDFGLDFLNKEGLEVREPVLTPPKYNYIGHLTTKAFIGHGKEYKDSLFKEDKVIGVAPTHVNPVVDMNGEKVYPLERLLKRKYHCEKTSYVHLNEFNKIRELSRSGYALPIKKCYRPILTVQEAANTIVCYHGSLPALNFKTSESFFVKRTATDVLSNARGKNKHFRIEADGSRTPIPSFIELCDDELRYLRNTDQPRAIVTAHLKADEKRPVLTDKLEAAAQWGMSYDDPNVPMIKIPRAIFNYGFQTLVNGRRLLADWLVACLKAPNSSVGINHATQEWSSLAHDVHLDDDKWCKFAIDVTSNDIKQCAQIEDAYINEVTTFYQKLGAPPDHLELIQKYLHSITWPYLLLLSEVCVPDAGNLSGRLDTTCLNIFSLSNTYKHALWKCHVELANTEFEAGEFYSETTKHHYPTAVKHESLLTLQEFLDHVVIKMFGDDGLGAIHHSVFVPTAYFAHMVTYITGYTVTGASKNDRPCGCGTKGCLWLADQEPSDLTFLKRGFVLEGTRYKAPLNKDSIWGMLYYISQKEDPTIGSYTNARLALWEAFFHGEEFFREISDFLKRRCDEEQLPDKFCHRYSLYTSYWMRDQAYFEFPPLEEGEVSSDFIVAKGDSPTSSTIQTTTMESPSERKSGSENRYTELSTFFGDVASKAKTIILDEREFLVLNSDIRTLFRMAAAELSPTQNHHFFLFNLSRVILEESTDTRILPAFVLSNRLFSEFYNDQAQVETGWLYQVKPSYYQPLTAHMDDEDRLREGALGQACGVTMKGGYLCFEKKYYDLKNFNWVNAYAVACCYIDLSRSKVDASEVKKLKSVLNNTKAAPRKPIQVDDSDITLIKADTTKLAKLRKTVYENWNKVANKVRVPVVGDLLKRTLLKLEGIGVPEYKRQEMVENARKNPEAWYKTMYRLIKAALVAPFYLIIHVGQVGSNRLLASDTALGQTLNLVSMVVQYIGIGFFAVGLLEIGMELVACWMAALTPVLYMYSWVLVIPSLAVIITYLINVLGYALPDCLLYKKPDFKTYIIQRDKSEEGSPGDEVAQDQ